MEKTALYKNTLAFMSILDEKFSRIFTLGRTKSLTEAVDLIDISNLKSRCEKFESFADKLLADIVNNPNAYDEDSINYLKKEIEWSISQCESYLSLLKKVKGTTTDAKALTDPNTLASLLLYKAGLEKI